ncbi:unnamed protein product, partial [Musa textilis]
MKSTLGRKDSSMAQQIVTSAINKRILCQKRILMFPFISLWLY